MEELFSVAIYLIFVYGVIKFLRKNIWKTTGTKPGGTALGNGSVPARKYESYSRKTHNRQSGAMPHKHEKGHYTSMPDVSKLPPGYILLNGEPVRVADLEGK